MSNNIFAALRRRMTVMYALVFGLVSLLIVALTCGLVWLGVMQLEKEALLETAQQAAAEYLAADRQEHDTAEHGSHNGMRRMQGRGRNSDRHQPLPSLNKNILRLIATPQGIELPDKERSAEAEPLLQNRSVWPRQNNEVLSFTLTTEEGELHYLGAVLNLPNQRQLYIFKDMSVYYALAASVFSFLSALLLVLLSGAVLLSWWLAGRNLRPVEEMYLKQQQFTSDASHELRTPLNVLRLAVRALSEDSDSRFSAFAQKNLQIMDEESSRLERLTDELLLLTRSDSGRLGDSFTTVDFSAVCTSVLEKMSLPAAEKDIFLDNAIAEKITLQGDEGSLQRLVIILLDNAIKYSPIGSDVSLRLSREQQQICLTVADNGPGISDAEKPHVTDRFYRGDKARGREGGAGLGLALAAAIVRQHGGSLEILDNTPTGTIMKISL